MGAVLIGVGLAIAIIGLLLGAVGFGSSETTSGAALLTAGSIGFIGGILLLGLGFVHRALVDIAQRLDGIVHFEPDEEEAVESARLEVVREDFAPMLGPQAEEQPAAPMAATEPVAAAPQAEEAKPARGGLPSWFRRKREPEPEAAPEDEPEIAPEPTVEAPPEGQPQPPFRPTGEPRRELPAFLRTGSAGERPAERPLSGGFGIEPRPAEPRFTDLRFGEPRAGEPRAPEPRPSEPRVSEPRASESAPREEFEPGPPPTFLRESDLLGEEEPPAPEPEITVLKAGTIGGMAYKLYSDGSIEADLPDGTLRFASLQELRDHVSGSATRNEG